ncbi:MULTISPECIES: putative ATP-grasp-modified RiPP [unclassified Streptomyces]|uniref:putative ATP-grasp-modified RiPP n=1 Tax=unclassified Streptomyces TaxID=2593676 RepID=UPI002ED46A5E|nr:putative ATP-grasp-modified RiPP [Streptomyces sp. NBC_00891]WSY10115.1 putative ATP-grasp-modified RiPP [Streptomyces sp. NBC_00890]WSZ11751.1 putative ATP-grasp-modified RiPP [Streptomyces sp. NBC_00869]WSZ27843.1 putative ATP-grasp-modified RiPP [Streptomyces sp. NBC_00870]
MTTAPEREAFPLTPPGGRIPHSTEPPSGPLTRPWALRFARVPDATEAVRVLPHFYDHERQVNLSHGGDLLTCMANTHSPTIPDGSTTNPPPLDEGPKD